MNARSENTWGRLHGWAIRVLALFAGACAGPSTESPATTFTLAAGRPQPTAVLATESQVIWQEGQRIVRVPHNGGAAEDLQAVGHAGWGIAAYDGSLYWLSREFENGSVRKLSTRNGESVVVAENQNHPYAIAVNATHVFFGAETTVPDVHALRVVPNNGGTVSTIAADQWGISGIAADDKDVFWATRIDGRGKVLSAPAAGGTIRVLAELQGEPHEIVLDATNVYFTNDASYNGAKSSVMKASRSDGALSVLAEDEVRPFAIAADATNVYWTNFRKGGTGTIRKVAKSGGTPVTLADGQDGPNAIAVHGPYVFWTNLVSGTVMRTNAAR